MKRFSLVAACFIFTAVFSISAFGQAPAAVPSGKVGLVNVNAFADTGGIAKFKTALNSIDTEFKPLNDELKNLQTKYQTLAADIQNQQKMLADPNNKVPINQQALQSKVEEAQNLEIEIKRKQEDGKRKYENRYQTVVGPIFNDIIKAMNDYAKAKGYSVILDGAKLEESGVLMGFDDKYDVTKDFITFYNGRPATTATTAVPK